MPSFRDAHLRHAEHYRAILNVANQLYEQGGDALEQGLDWFDRDWTNIRSGLNWAAENFGSDSAAAMLCSQYVDSGAEIFQLRLHPRQRLKWLRAALIAAQLSKDRAREGKHSGNLGITYGLLGRLSEAKPCVEQHLAIARELGDRQGEGRALGNLGNLYNLIGERQKAIELYQQRLNITRQMGDRLGEAQALSNLGMAYENLGEMGPALEFQKQGLAIKREIGDRYGEVQALTNLGVVYADIGDVRRAIECQEQALEIARDIGDERGEGAALGNLGARYLDLGKAQVAVEFFRQQLDIARRTGDLHSEGTALWNMSMALEKLRDQAQSLAHAESALRIYEQIQDPRAANVRGLLRRLSRDVSKKRWRFW